MTDETQRPDADSTEATTHVCHDWESDSPLSLTIIDALATHRATAPTDLDPLHGVVDLEALEALIDSFDRSPARVRFSYDGHDVTVAADGGVAVRDAAADGG